MTSPLDCGSGLAFSSDPVTGRPGLCGQFRIDATGAQVLTRGGEDLSVMAAHRPWGGRLAGFAATAEREAGHPVRIEFVVERGEPRVLAVTRARLRGAALLGQVTARLVAGDIDEREALERVGEEDLARAMAPAASATGLATVAHGLPTAPGVSGGVAVFSAAAAVAARAAGRAPVLLLPEALPEDLPGLLAAAAVVTERGGSTSHAAVVTRGLGRVCVTALTDAVVDASVPCLRPAAGVPVVEGDDVTVDGDRGVVYAGALGPDDRSGPAPAEAVGGVDALLRVADRHARVGVRVNADTPADARAGLAQGASGIGLCRIEHMLLGARQPLLASVLTGASSAATGEALARLTGLLRADFLDILRILDGRPVTVRVLDPPRHEFLPDLSDPQTAAALADDPARMAVVRRLREANPMLGVRGVRLAALDPHLLTAQVTALVAATTQLRREGRDPRPELLVPMVSVPGEIDLVRDCLAEVSEAMGLSAPGGPMPLGAMVETPRAALLAAELAVRADFLSIGSNDLTALVYGLSRDDAERELLPRYRELGLVEDSPFACWDAAGLGQLLRRAISEARAVAPDIRIGLCGEHGVDPAAAAMVHRLGVDYVSCSPARVAVGRLAMARAALCSSSTGGGQEAAGSG